MTTNCSLTAYGKVDTKRMFQCMKGLQVTTIAFDTEGEVVGEAAFEVDSSYTLSATSTEWTEQVTVTMLAATTPAVAAMYVQIGANCSSTCSLGISDAWLIAPLLTLGISVTGSLTFSDPVASGTKDLTSASYNMIDWTPGGTPLTPATWTDPHGVRCDAMVTAYSGCTHSDINALASMTVADYGAAAATYR